MSGVAEGPIRNLINHPPAKYGDFLKAIDDRMGDLKTTRVSRRVRKDLKKTLISANEKKISAKPKSFPRLSKFFEKVGQFFQGHGFQTKRKYGRQLFNEIEVVQKNIWRKDLKNYLGESSPFYDFGGMIQEIKNMDVNSPQFKDFKEAYLNTKAKPPNESITGEHKKIRIFNALTKKQREALAGFKGSGVSWYENNFRILKGASEKDMQAFITDEELQSFISHPLSLLLIWPQYEKDPKFKDFAKVLIVGAYQKALAQDANAAIKWTSFLTKDPLYGEDIRKILREAKEASAKDKVLFDKDDELESTSIIEKPHN